nr:DNA methyltransferase [Candidatus Sigynarchaeota archaeon]
MLIHHDMFHEEEGFSLIKGDCIEVMQGFDDRQFDMIFADPPYFLSNDGITCHSGEMVKVNKGEWDRSGGFDEDVKFTGAWLAECKRVLKDTGTIWISGTMHIIYKIGYLLEKNGFKIINDIVWFKSNAPPNLSCKYFTHSHEIVLWAKKDNDEKHCFNYDLMKNWDDPNDRIKNQGKQMRSVWWSPLIPQEEKVHGSHPTQKPLFLLLRLIAASTNKGDSVLDPFNGSGTTGIAASLLERNYTGIEIEDQYLKLTVERLKHKKELDFYYPRAKKKINLSTFVE